MTVPSQGVGGEPPHGLQWIHLPPVASLYCPLTLMQIRSAPQLMYMLDLRTSGFESAWRKKGLVFLVNFKDIPVRIIPLCKSGMLLSWEPDL